MLQEFKFDNALDAEGRPDGGFVQGVGLDIEWQRGPLGRGVDRVEPNGAFVETVIAAVISRIEFYQEHFPCDENAEALIYLETALAALNERTARREAAGIEGTHVKDGE